ncbi:MAG: DUF6932 family protein [Terriglobales bacterium]
MIPSFQAGGNLPPGVHKGTWEEIRARFGGNPHRRKLLRGLRKAFKSLKAAGCRTVFLDGSFVTAKDLPPDYDACWDVKGVVPNRLDPVFLDFSRGRAAQKAKYLGEFFPADLPEGASGKAFLEFFQTDKETGRRKGIVAIDLKGRLP